MTTTTPASTRPRGRRHRRRLVTTLVTLVLTLSALAACEPDVAPPYWTLGPKFADVRPTGAHVVLDWRDAVGSTRYRVQAALVTSGSPGPWLDVPMDVPAVSACLVVGLDAPREYRFRITAYDAAGNWSGDLSGAQDIGSLGASYDTPPIGGGAVRKCLPATDGDGDRVPNALESGTGTPTSATALGTYPNDPDSDDDGIDDGDELYGSVAGLDLPAMGTTPLRKDVLLELDWASQITGCAANLQPTASWITPIRQAFAAMPYQAPGPDGVNLIVDYGQGGLFTGGNAIPDANGRLANDPLGSDPRGQHFAPGRVGYFHYGTVGTEVFAVDNWAQRGLAGLDGDWLRIGVGCNAMPEFVRSNLTMHELGHNLHLRHGGHEDVNKKPNYGSIMNYRYLSVGADGNCDGRPDSGLLAYSDEVRGPIDENHIDEVAGFCPGVPADIDLDGSIDPAPYVFDVNGGGRSVLIGSDDFAHIEFDAFNDPNRVRGQVEVCDPFV
ncbi:MAG TPA: hypothetical protein VGO60_08410 [Iamia sp.]|jgi:hypothetical protein|nr:hypothetical protein [Iamia sp.]